MARRFGEIDFTIKHSPYPQLPLEVALVEASQSRRRSPPRSRPVLSGLSSIQFRSDRPPLGTSHVAARPGSLPSTIREMRRRSHPEPTTLNRRR